MAIMPGRKLICLYWLTGKQEIKNNTGKSLNGIFFSVLNVLLNNIKIKHQQLWISTKLQISYYLSYKLRVVEAKSSLGLGGWR